MVEYFVNHIICHNWNIAADKILLRQNIFFLLVSQRGRELGGIDERKI